jgi:hypothetical protein
MFLRRISAAALIAVFLALSIAPFTAGSQEDASAAFTQTSLSAITRWEHLIYETKQEPAQVQIYAESMLERLTWIYEVDKVPAAMPHMLKLLGAVDVESRYGFSHDGRIGAMITRMDLMEPAFDNYSIFLINIENKSAFALDSSQCKLNFTLKDGKVLVPEDIVKEHPLFPRLERLAGTFRPPERVSPGATASFKSALAVPGIDQRQLSYVSLEMGGHSVMIKFYENLDYPKGAQ